MGAGQAAALSDPRAALFDDTEPQITRPADMGAAALVHSLMFTLAKAAPASIDRE